MARFHCYVVYRGHHLRIYHTWNDCKAQVLGYPNTEFKGFNNMEGARVSFLNYHGQVKLKPEPASMLTSMTSGRSERILVRVETLPWILISLLVFICLLWCFVIYLAMVDYHQSTSCKYLLYGILYECYYAGLYKKSLQLCCLAVAHCRYLHRGRLQCVFFWYPECLYALQKSGLSFPR